jgi:hypothetical protein
MRKKELLSSNDRREKRVNTAASDGRFFMRAKRELKQTANSKQQTANSMSTIQLDHRVMKIRSARATTDFRLFAVCCLLFTL